jgi:CheY-like chemotaxis protein
MFPTSARILIVDDATFARKVLKDTLVELQYLNIFETGMALEGQHILAAQEQRGDPIHLVITDLHMAEVSGVELVRWIRNRPGTKELPIMVITSSQDKSEILEVGKLGVSHYLVKPYEPVILKAKLASTWAKHGEKFWNSLKTAV